MSGEPVLTRNGARELWAASGLSYDALTKESLARLRKVIDDALRASGCINGTFRAGRAAKLVTKPASRRWADIRCQAYYFTDRQAVTFEPNGFIGFAGWASDENVAPILKAFSTWVREMTGSETSQLATEPEVAR